MKLLRLLPVFALLISALIIGCEGCEDDLVEKLQAPTFKIKRGTNYDLVISAGTKGADVKYTLDGTDPKKSDATETELELSIDFFTKINAYALKDGYRDSETVEYSLPLHNDTRFIKYKTDLTVDYYTISYNDCNNKKKVEITYNAKGDDKQWFTNDDTIQKYVLNNYDSGDLKKEVTYSSSGSDGKWRTIDDSIAEYSEFTTNAGKITKKEIYTTAGEKNGYWTFTYTGNNLTKIDKYNGSGSSAGSIAYEYNAAGVITKQINYSSSGAVDTTVENSISATNIISSSSTKNSSGTITGFGEYIYTNIDYYYTFDYNTSGKPEKLTKFWGYGTDTQCAVEDYTYNGSELSETILYKDFLKTEISNVTSWTFRSSLLSEKTMFKDKNKTVLDSKEVYEYNGDKLSKVNFYDNEKELIQYKTFSYEGNYPVKLYKRPSAASKTFTMDLTIQANSINGGSYSVDGSSFSHSGDPISAIVDKNSSLAEYVKTAVKKIEYIIKNGKVTESSAIINGKKGGYIKVVSYSSADNELKLNFEFADYNDGDLIISGKIDEQLEGTVDISGNVSGSLSGTVKGSVTITDANPKYDTEEYLLSEITNRVYNSASLLDKETIYNGAGVDGKWETADDNVSAVILYTYNGTSVISKTAYKKAGGDNTWLTADDVLDYKIVYTYSGVNKVKEEFYRNYGTYIRNYSTAGADTNWDTTADNVFSNSSLTYVKE